MQEGGFLELFSASLVASPTLTPSRFESPDLLLPGAVVVLDLLDRGAEHREARHLRERLARWDLLGPTLHLNQTLRLVIIMRLVAVHLTWYWNMHDVLGVFNYHHEISSGTSDMVLEYA